MGLFSTVINHCPLLGEGLMGELQTKDLENLMDYYWLSPDGHLYLIDLADCFELNVNSQADKWNEKFCYEKTGKRGRVKPYKRTFIARLYNCSLEVFVRFSLGTAIEILSKEEVFYVE